MKRAVRGRDELVLSGEDLVAKLAVLVPPPRIHLVRFHGVFAPNAKLRSRVVPSPSPPTSAACEHDFVIRCRRGASTFAFDWASLLRRVFAVDVLQCQKCEGRMKVLAVVQEPSAVTKILEHLDLPSTVLETARARGPPQPRFAFDDTA